MQEHLGPQLKKAPHPVSGTTSPDSLKTVRALLRVWPDSLVLCSFLGTCVEDAAGSFPCIWTGGCSKLLHLSAGKWGFNRSACTKALSYGCRR